MGRKKIKIERIPGDRSRTITFTKRKKGLIKKAMELSLLCDCNIGLLIVDPTTSEITTYSSNGNLDALLEQFAESPDNPSAERFCDQDYERLYSKDEEDVENASKTSTSKVDSHGIDNFASKQQGDDAKRVPLLKNDPHSLLDRSVKREYAIFGNESTADWQAQQQHLSAHYSRPQHHGEQKLDAINTGTWKRTRSESFAAKHDGESQSPMLNQYANYPHFDSTVTFETDPRLGMFVPHQPTSVSPSTKSQSPQSLHKHQQQHHQMITSGTVNQGDLGSSSTNPQVLKRLNTGKIIVGEASGARNPRHHNADYEQQQHEMYVKGHYARSSASPQFENAEWSASPSSLLESYPPSRTAAQQHGYDSTEATTPRYGAMRNPAGMMPGSSQSQWDGSPVHQLKTDSRHGAASRSQESPTKKPDETKPY